MRSTVSVYMPLMLEEPDTDGHFESALQCQLRRQREIAVGTIVRHRAQPGSLVRRIEGLLSRTINAFTPDDVRVGDKFRRGCEDMDRILGKIFGAAICVNDGNLHAGMQGVREGIRALIVECQRFDRRGIAARAAILARLDIHLNALTLDELCSASKGLSAPEVRAELATLPDYRDANLSALLCGQIDAARLAQLEKRCGREIDAALRDVVEAVRREIVRPGAVGRALTAAYAKGHGAADWLRREGLQEMAFQARSTAGIQGFLDALVKDGMTRLPLECMAAVLPRVPTQFLRGLRRAPPYRDNAANARVDAALRQEIEARYSRRVKAFQVADQAWRDKLALELARDGGPSLAALADVLADAARRCASMRHHARLHELPVAAEVEAQCRTLVACAQQQVGQLRGELASLPAPQLYALQLAMQHLDIDDVDEDVAAIIAEHKQLVRASYLERLPELWGQLHRALDDMGGEHGSDGAAVATLLHRLGELDDAEAAALTLYRQFGSAEQDAGQLAAFRQELIEPGVAVLELAQLRALHRCLTGITACELKACLYQAGHGVTASYPLLGQSVLKCWRQLEAIDAVVRDRLLCLDADPLCSTHISPVRVAIRQAFGIQVGAADDVPQVESGAAPESMQCALAHDVERCAGEAAMATVAGQGQLGVADVFWRALSEQDHQLGLDGVPLVDRAGWACLDGRAREQRMLDGLARLRDTLGDALALRMSRYAHHGLIRGIQVTLATRASPIALADGSRGRLSGGTEEWRYLFLSAADGAPAKLRVEYAIRAPRRLHDVAQERMRRLLPEQSHAQFSVELYFYPEDEGATIQPVQFSYRLKEDSWQKPYDRPKDMRQILNMADPDLRADFEDFLGEHGGLRAYEFVRAVQSYNKLCTVGEARRIWLTFFEHGTVEGLPVPSYVRMQIYSNYLRLSGLGERERTSVALYASAFEATVRWLDETTFQPFCATLESARQTS